jgi:glycine/D-amino acid oxidase-like deaminating enzyme/nitrite reductase/ring-hydroxylating ferredoxin subunit
MFTKSVWNEYAGPLHFPALNKNLTVDIAVMGGGVTGISTALLLAESGYSVAVFESKKIGGGTTGHSTGNLYSTIDKNLDHLKEKYDDDIIRQVVDSRATAIDTMERWVDRFTLDCGFKRVPWYLYAYNESNEKRVVKEFDTAKNAGLDVTWAASELPLKAVRGMKVPKQAQLNPRRYVQGLAEAAASQGVSIFEGTRVSDISEKKDHVELKTTGGNVTARYAIHATHIPKGIMAVQMVLSMHREYGVAFHAGDKSFPDGIFWGYHGEGKKYSSRLYTHDDQRYVLVVGEPHRVGQEKDNRENLKNLIDFGREHYSLTDVRFEWGGQNYKPADLLPYIGRKSSDSNIFIATGFSTDGLVYGTLAAMLMSDEIQKKDNPWASLYSAHRFTPVKSAGNAIKEGINTLKQFKKNLPGQADEKNFDHIAAGDGAIVEKDGKKIAACRDEQGKLMLNSAVCPHMKCIVQWNKAEKTWDCPCHASRFTSSGQVIEGPAFDPLSTL